MFRVSITRIHSYSSSLSEGCRFIPPQYTFSSVYFHIRPSNCLLTHEETVGLSCQGAIWILIILDKSGISTVPRKSEYEHAFLEIPDLKLFLKRR